MNKIDDILERLQNQPQPTVDLPDELTDSIMSALPDREAVEPKPQRRYGLYALSALSVAAGIALLLVLRFGNATEEPKQANKTQPTVIHKTQPTVKSPSLGRSRTASTAKATPAVLRTSPASNGSPLNAATASNGSPLIAATASNGSPLNAATVPDGSPSGSPAKPADSTAILTARIEAEMQQISDDCYMERLSRTINNDPQLRRLVDDFINETTEEARSAVHVKHL